MFCIACIFFLISLIKSVDPNCDYTKILVNEECPSDFGIDWELYGEELYKARGLLFAGQKGLSKKLVADLLNVITGRAFHIGFECPLATASTFFSLASMMANENRLRRAQALILMGFIFIRDKGFHDCTPWPIQGWDMMIAGRNMREIIRPLDDFSVMYSIPKSSRFFSSHNVAIVSICAYAPDEPVRVLAEDNHHLYASLHGYKLYQFGNQSEILENEGMSVKDKKPFFWKVNALMNAMDDMEVSRNFDEGDQWLMWVDCDAFFMDPERTIDSVVGMFSGNLSAPLIRPNNKVSQIIREDETPIELLIAVDSTGINNGVFMIRNSPWSKSFLKTWWNSPILQGKGAAHNCSDQSTMQHALLYENSMRDINNEFGELWDSVEAPIWPREVRVVPQEYLQSFHQATAISVLSREWEDGDFVKHHPGCHYYKIPCQYMYQEANNIFREKVQNLFDSGK